MSKRAMPWPKRGQHVRVEFVDVCEGTWPDWVFRGSYGHWLCLEPIGAPLDRDVKPVLHWFPTTIVACMVEVGDE